MGRGAKGRGSTESTREQVMERTERRKWQCGGAKRPSRGSTVKSRSHPPFSPFSEAGAGDLCCEPKPQQLLCR